MTHRLWIGPHWSTAAHQPHSEQHHSTTPSSSSFSFSVYKQDSSLSFSISLSFAFFYSLSTAPAAHTVSPTVASFIPSNMASHTIYALHSPTSHGALSYIDSTTGPLPDALKEHTGNPNAKVAEMLKNQVGEMTIAPLCTVTGNEKRAQTAVDFYSLYLKYKQTQKGVLVMNSGPCDADMYTAHGQTWATIERIKEAYGVNGYTAPTDEAIDFIMGKALVKMVTCGVCGFVCDQRNIARHRKSSTCVPGKKPTKAEKAALAKARQNEKATCELCGFVTMVRNLPRHQEGSRCKKRAKMKAEEEARDVCVECEIESEE